MASDVKQDGSSSLIRTIFLVAGAHIIMILTDGTTISFGIFLTDLADELNAGLGVIGAASSLLTSALHTFSPLGAYIASKIGYRRTVVIGTLLIAVGFMISSQVQATWQLFISHSAITGLGISLVFSNTVAFVGMSCDKHISIANGVLAAGTAVGLIIVPLLINVLREMYGWRGAMLILGACVLHATVLSIILFRTPLPQSKSDVSRSEGSSKEDDECMEISSDNAVEKKEEDADIQPIETKILRLPIVYPLLGFLMIVANLVWLAFSGTIYHLVSSAIKSGISEQKAAILMTIYGIGNIISRMLHGVPIKLKLISTKNLFAIALLTDGLATFMLPFCKTYQSICSVTLLIGLSTGTCIPLIMLSTREIVGIRLFPKALGILLCSTGFAGLVGGSFAGWIYDYFGSYNLAFFIMGSFFFAACFFLVVPRLCLEHTQNRSYNNIKVNSETISLSEPGTTIATL